MRKIAVIGLGYVGLPLALAFGKKQKVLGFDTNEKRIEALKKSIDLNEEYSKEDFKGTNIEFTANRDDLKKADFYIVTVPTPITPKNQPDFAPIISASKSIGKYLKKGDIVVYESTVYPGVTEEVCVPLLEKKSELKHLKDFNVGYSPERMNPGDKEHTVEKITKVVAGDTPESLKIIASEYGKILKNGMHLASSIKVAEAAKVIENTQRDLNIALMNEIAMIFHKMNIDTNEVLEAAGTKWNFLKFKPGLVGGHCIGVDPYYLVYKARKMHAKPDLIKMARATNSKVPTFIAKEVLSNVKKKPIITVFGLTFKEDCTDTRNTKVVDIIKVLQKAGAKVQVTDAWADKESVRHEYGIDLMPEKYLKPADGIIMAVAHQKYKAKGWKVTEFLKDKKALVADIKAILDPKKIPEGVKLWRL